MSERKTISINWDSFPSPCPFCGGDNLSLAPNDHGLSIQCVSCFAYGPAIKEDGAANDLDWERLAEIVWDRRTNKL